MKKLSLSIDGNIINKANIIPYPLTELKGFLISNKINQEPIYLYMNEEQYLLLTHSLKIKDYHLINDKNIINRLIQDICYYLDTFFKAYPLSNRIIISFQEEMKKIKPCFSFILIPDEKFKAKIKLNEFSQKYKKLKDEIFKMRKKRKHYVNEIKIISSLFLNRDSEHKITLMDQISSEPNEIEKPKIIKSLNSKLLSLKTYKIKYKQIIRDIFTTRLNDFRTNIVEYCLENTKYLREDNFENFVCFIEFFCLLFCGIKTKYYVDELSYLNMDFYADEKNIMNSAESFHYQVQFRIKDISFIAPYGKRKRHSQYSAEEKEKIIKEKKDKIQELNMQKIPSINQGKVELYPTHCDFSRMISPRFRRYDLNDDYHICIKCQNIPNSNKCTKLKCSSCFRQIDKERLISLNLSHIMNFNIILKLIKNNSENEIFEDMIINPNYSGLRHRVNNKELILNYLIPFETKEILKINKIYRDIFGEHIGFYFVWISHYIKWLFYPALVGLIMSFLYYMPNNNLNKGISLIMNLVFIAFIILWGNYYYSSWEGQESFYNYIWGMNDHKLINNNMWDIEENNEINIEIIMGVKIPLETSFDYWIINSFLFILSLFMHILMIISNILLISTKLYIFNIKNKKIESFLNHYWKYFVSFLCFILREIFSLISEKWNKWIINHQKQITKEQKKEIKLEMQIIFEFFNYYFNLYYIAFIKNYYGTCLDNDCHSELGDQLIIIIICDLVCTIINLLIPALYKIKIRQELESKIKLYNILHDNYSNKFLYYSRNKFQFKDMKNYYLKAILYFGYIIQFGASAPMSFFIILLTLIFNRIVLGISLKIIYFAQVFEESIGLNKMIKLIKIIIYIGIISNLLCIFYTNDYFDSLTNARKLIYIALTQNFVLIIIQLFNYDSLPKWFYFKDKIDFTYLRKFGIREKKLDLYSENIDKENK